MAVWGHSTRLFKDLDTARDKISAVGSWKEPNAQYWLNRGEAAYLMAPRKKLLKWLKENVSRAGGKVSCNFESGNDTLSFAWELGSNRRQNLKQFFDPRLTSRAVVGGIKHGTLGHVIKGWGAGIREAYKNQMIVAVFNSNVPVKDIPPGSITLQTSKLRYEELYSHLITRVPELAQQAQEAEDMVDRLGNMGLWN